MFLFRLIVMFLFSLKLGFKFNIVYFFFWIMYLIIVKKKEIFFFKV